MADELTRRIRQAQREAADLARDMAAQRSLAETPATTKAANVYRDRFNAEWSEIIEDLIDEQEAPHVVARTEHAGDPPEYALDPRYVPPDELPPGNVSPEYDTLTGFLYGKEWLFVTSSWVRAIQFNDEEQSLTIEFNEGATCLYPGVTEHQAMEFATAPSKGRWVHQNLIPWDYVLLSVGASGGKVEARTPAYAPGPRQVNRYGPGKGSITRLRPPKRRSYKPG